MPNIRSLLLSGAALAALTSAAAAGQFDTSASYNSPVGMSAGQMNAPVNSSLRDQNGNLEVVDGKITSSSFMEVGGVQSFNPGGTSGVGGTTSATAIGNQLNVITAGSNNIVIVDSTQINNGDQTANANNGQ
ncbi:MAG TPA: holdfast anchoring protein HfaA [Rhizomicrobium sp.]|jgi:holdfast attachment protein HfaA|nr:holdfast anchoring protein HfaA [Rhizomicrobium sp.]